MVSVVIACYDEEPHLEESVAELMATLDATVWPYELIFVDDGSSDGSFDESELQAVELAHHGDGRFTGSFVADGAGPWGATARAMPTHPGLVSIYDTGLVANG